MAERMSSFAWDWHKGTVPGNVWIAEDAYVESTYSFLRFRSRDPEAVRVSAGASVYVGTMFDVGPRGRVRLGEFTLVNAARIVCDREITIGPYCLLSWNVLVMDTYGMPIDSAARRRALRARAHGGPDRSDDDDPRPVNIGANVWIGFSACVLPGVTIGDGAIVGARSVVASDVPPYTIVAGCPARVIRTLTPPPAEGACS
jgi:acetyltransferase-like isoleucine patch superfamily enzyme